MTTTISESAVRQKARRRELLLHKSRSRTPEHYDYETYQLVDFNNCLVLGDSNTAQGYGMSLEDCNEYLTEGSNQ